VSDKSAKFKQYIAESLRQSGPGERWLYKGRVWSGRKMTVSREAWKSEVEGCAGNGGLIRRDSLDKRTTRFSSLAGLRWVPEPPYRAPERRTHGHRLQDNRKSVAVANQVASPGSTTYSWLVY
jgi:hypothetical protein